MLRSCLPVLSLPVLSLPVLRGGAAHLRAIRGIVSLLGLALLAACSSGGNQAAPPLDQSQQATQYLARARRDYSPPGPSEDPWGPYIREASQRYDVPGRWIREVMGVESGGDEYQHGTLTTSPVGAMGLMQIMPETYDYLKSRYGLADDAYDPRNNIMAGTAYIREMYDLYGVPGFLAAYNAGPKRLDEYLANQAGLPAETRRYVAMIGPRIEGTYPQSRSSSDLYAMNRIPDDIPPGLRYPPARPAVRYAKAKAPVRYAAATQRGHSTHGRLTQSPARRPTEVAQLPEPPRPARTSHEYAYAPPTPPRRGFHLIQPAVAATLPLGRGGPTSGGWGIQVGAFGSEPQAAAAATAARSHAQIALAHAGVRVGTLHEAHNKTLYRARLGGLSRAAAVEACRSLRTSCMVISPEAM